MYKKLLIGTALCSSIFSANTTLAQPSWRGGEGGRGEVRRSANQLRDDVRDLNRFQTTLAIFEDAWRRRDLGALRGSLHSFVAQGRAGGIPHARLPRLELDDQATARVAVHAAFELPQMRRVDDVGGDRVDADAVARQFECRRARVVDHAGLGGGVGGVAGCGAHAFD